MEIHTNYITIIHSKSIRNCSKGIKFGDYIQLYTIYIKQKPDND